MNEKIEVEVPMSEARRDRVEREVFARLDAMRDVDRANAVAPAVRGRRLPLIAAGFAFVAAAASVVFLVSREAPTPPPSAPSLVVTPSGGSSRFTVGDSVIDAGSDTSVEVKHDASGATTLLLARGSVDCDVQHRPNRAPFRVVAGDVTVEVVGTRFAVSRVGNTTRVDVARGRVSVHGNGEKRMIGAGESWTSAPLVTAAKTTVVVEPIETPPVAAKEPPEIEIPPEPVRATKPRVVNPEDLYTAALKLDNLAERKRAYQTIAKGDHAWAALSLFNLAELQAKDGDVDATLRTLDELKRRFPKHGNAEDAAWFRVDVLRDARRTEAAQAAAADYLRDFPQGTYAKLAARLVRP
jgi:hypothetical protein